MIGRDMARSGTWWLVAAAVTAGFLGVVLKATDVHRSAAPTAIPHAQDVGEPAPAGTPLAAAVDRAARTSPAAPAADAPRAHDEDDAVASAPRDDLEPSAPVRHAAPGEPSGERARPHVLGRHRAARERERQRAESGSLRAGAVGGDAGTALAPAAGPRAATQAAAPVTANAPANVADQHEPAAAPAPDVTYASGDQRQFATNAPVEVSNTPNLAGPSGTLSFWLQPTWQDGNQDDATLLDLGDGMLRVVKNVDFIRFEWTDETGDTGGIGAPIAEWKTGEWHEVTSTWNGTSFALYIDGRLVSQKSDAGSVGLPSDATLVVGSNFPQNRPVAPGVIQQVDVHNRPLTAGEVANQFASVQPNAHH